MGAYACSGELKFAQICFQTRRHDIQENDTQHNNKNLTFGIMTLDDECHHAHWHALVYSSAAVLYKATRHSA
jgi:hypothetical protein